MTVDNVVMDVPDARQMNGRLPASLGFQPCGRQGAPWFCVWTKPGQEHIADRALQADGFTTFFPLYGARRAAYVPMFRRYGFAQPDANGQWVKMLHTRGVANLIRNPFGKPTPVPQYAMDQLFAQCAPNGVIFEPSPALPRKGDAIRVLEGPLTGFEGICARSSAERVWLLLTLLGRAVEVPFGATAVEAV